MAEYRKENALLIKEMRIELGLEDPEKTVDAPLEDIAHDQKAQAETEVEPPPEVQPKGQGAPADDASVTLHAQDASKDNSSPKQTQDQNQDAP